LGTLGFKIAIIISKETEDTTKQFAAKAAKLKDHLALFFKIYSFLFKKREGFLNPFFIFCFPFFEDFFK